MMTEAEKKEVGRVIGAISLLQRDVIIAVALSLTTNSAPFEMQTLMLVSVNLMLSKIGVLKVLSILDLSQYLKVAKFHGVIDSVPDRENRTKNIVTLTTLGRKMAEYYEDEVNSTEVDPADVDRLRLYFHRKRLSIGVWLSIRDIFMGAQKGLHFALRLENVSLTMQRAYVLRVMESAFSRRFEVVDVDTIQVLELLRMF